MADGLACCVPLAREPISVEQANGVVPMLKAIADPARLRLLSLVLSHEGGEACVCDLLPYFDVALDEQCFQYHECDRLRPFVAAGKAVFTVEYKLELSDFCTEAADLGFNSMKKKLSLRVWRAPCP